MSTALRTRTMHRKKLPIGIQTFAKLREDGCYYVDKTAFALRLIESGTHWFLSRPRRFGKSLFLDTLAELFSGDEALFRGLHVHDRWDWGRRFPVLRLSFGGGLVRDLAGLEQKCWEQLRVNQSALGVSCTEPTLAGCFAQLIRTLHVQHGERVVVLVDEYDKPILDNLTRLEPARAIRDGLRDLYSVIKDSDAHIRFAFLTGVSKFSKVSLFSGLNNLRDITLSAEYSAICGYTETDLDQVFAPELEGLDRTQVRDWYNGYNWGGEAVYNPFDLLLLFQERDFRPWWFETGTPRFLVDLLIERETWLPRLGQQVAPEALLSRFDVGDLPSEALLFQTGYLTIDRAEWTGAHRLYHLRYPNLEVRMALGEQLLDAFTDGRALTDAQLYRLPKVLAARDFDGLRTLITALFDAIPTQWHTRSPIARYEGYYASVLYAYLAAQGLDLTAEDSSRAGRLDLAVRYGGQRYLFEFKVVELTPNGSALRQIKERGYSDKYRAEGLPIHLVGIEFSRKRRALVGFEVEAGVAGDGAGRC